MAKSLLGKEWILKNSEPDMTIVEKLLTNRGIITSDERIRFLKPDISALHDPFLFADMKAIVGRIKKAIAAKERIMIFGDYDVDGITGTAIVVTVLQKLNAEVSCRIPHRVEDGYGISEKFIEEFAKNGVSLLISVDCGISCGSVITRAKEHGIDTIITDHHTIPADFPENAYAILHPKAENSGYPFAELTGAGVAFKLAQALIESLFPENEKRPMLEKLLELASLGTVADLGSLTGENRIIVREGLKHLTNTGWIGLKTLMDYAGISETVMNTTHIGFRIAPRINAAGRIGNPYIPLFLLLHNEPSSKLHTLARALEDLNTQRKTLTETIVTEAHAHMDTESALPPIIILEHPGWHIGVLGLVAGKLAEHYGRPALILQDCGETLVGSARTPDGYNIIEALSPCSQYLKTFGGHAQAAGLTVEKQHYADFREALREQMALQHRETTATSQLAIDCVLPHQEITLDLLGRLEALAPFGIDNTEPLFLVENITPKTFTRIGKTKEHLKMTAHLGSTECDIMAFRFGEHYNALREYHTLDVAARLEKNVWQGKTHLQLHALDFRKK